ncbi:hypothetical protein AGMMS50225_08030 [Betaproteobacteria bacterium]|nr:hypothetical protein AGMMS50225_08030 [Betaproteobacteria bacterium]
MVFIKFIVLLLVFLLLVGTGVLALIFRALARLAAPADKGNAARGAGAETPPARGGRHGYASPEAEAETMLCCAHCGLYVPESQGVRAHDAFFCSELHRREHQA